MEFMKAIGLAHNCVAEFDKISQKFEFRGGDADEVCLVNFCEQVGFTVAETKQGLTTLELRDRSKLKFDVFRKIEFTSERKRMSILVRDPTDDKIKLYIKGADNVVLSRLSTIQSDSIVAKTKKFVDCASMHGLRTLMVAMKEITEGELDVFL